MELRITELSSIENPREYAVHEVDDLRHLLLSGGQAECDPRRQHFYNLTSEKNAYYIHISPISGNVILLAKWLRQPSECYAEAETVLA
jgi:hypothetical protein